MGRGWKALVLAIAAALASASLAAAKEHAPPRKSAHVKRVGRRALPPDYARFARQRGAHIYAGRGDSPWRGRDYGYASLEGDPESGYGFYNLPPQVRVGAWRYNMRHRGPNPVLFAMAADAARYDYWAPPNRSYVYGVYSPFDGVGTPFFAGFYQ